MRRICHILLLLCIPFGMRAASSYGGKPFFRNFSAVEYHGHNRNFDVECDSTGKVYVANFEGLVTWDGEKWSVDHTPGISRITSLYKTPKGTIWFGGYNVLGTISRSGHLSYFAKETDNRQDFGEISDIFSSEGRLFFNAGEDQYVIRGSMIERCQTVEVELGTLSTWRGIPVNQSIEIDDMGLVAKATSSMGVVILDMDGNVTYTLDSRDGLCSDSVSAIAYDGKGSIWGATDNGLFQIVLSKVFSHYGPTDGLNGQVTSIVTDKAGRLIVGTLQGLYVLNDQDRFDKVPGLDLACWGLALSSGGDVLAATAQGVFKYTDKLDVISPRHTLSLLVEDDGSFIAGGVDGIYRYSSKNEEEKLSDAPNVAKLVRSDDGCVWAINYYQNTFCLSPGAHVFVPAENPGLNLLTEYTDNHGNIWRSNLDNRGIRTDNLSESELAWCKALDAYTIEALEIGDEVSYMGGLFGLVRIDVARLHTTSPFKPSVYIRSFSNEEFTVTFFSSLDKTDPIGEPEFSYRLRDDLPWSDWSIDPKVYIGTVPLGKYRLSVRCRDSFGQISESEALDFEIEAPFFLKWYALLFYLLILVLISFGVMQLRLRKIRLDRERLESLVEERTRELKDVQGQLIRKEREATVGKLTKGLIDRILNPMNYINNFSHLSLGLTKDLSENLEDDREKMSEDIFDDCTDVIGMMKSNLEKIEQHGLATTRILKAMEELLKDHSGKVEDCDVLQICQKDIEMLQNYNKDDISECGIEIKTDFPSEPVVVQANQVNVSKVIMSLFANSIYAVKKKYQKSVSGLPDSPQICLSLSRKLDGSGCVIEVFDNGIGIEDSILDKIFDPFFTTKPTGEAPGVGLYLSQQVIQDLGGEIKVESRKDEFTRVTVELP